MRPLGFLSVLLALAAPVAAQSIAHQGRLVEDGEPAEGRFDFAFTLYADAEADERVSETVEARGVEVEGGHFAVDLAFEEGLDGRDVWMETAVRPSGEGEYERLAPRTRLGGAPYAHALPEGALTGPMIADGALVAGPNVTVSRTGSGAVVISASGGGGGGELELPYGGSAADPSPVFSVSNTGAGAGGRFTSGGQVGLVASAPGQGSTGLSATGGGVGARLIGPTGLSVQATTAGAQITSGGDGLVVVGAGAVGGATPSDDNNGLEVRAAEGHGVFVAGVAGDGVYVERALSDGLVIGEVDNRGVVVEGAGHKGVFVQSAGDDGVAVLEAGEPSYFQFSSENNGLEVAGAEGHGLFVGRADLDGVRVVAAGGYAGNFSGDVRVTGDLELGGDLACADCVGSAAVSDGSLTGADVQDGALTGLDVQDGSISGADVTNGTITRADVADGTLTGQEVQDGSLRAVDLADEAGGDYAGTNDHVDLLRDQNMVVRSVTVSAPTAGQVIAWASGGARRKGSNTTVVWCSLTTGTTTGMPFGYQFGGTDDGVEGFTIEIDENSGVQHVPFASTKGVAVGAGPVTINLVCQEKNEDAFLYDVQVTALFVPTRY